MLARLLSFALAACTGTTPAPPTDAGTGLPGDTGDTVAPPESGGPGTGDSGTPCVPLLVFADLDGDGFGDLATSAEQCALEPGYVLDSTDCDDTLPEVHPGASTACDDHLDDDCDGLTDVGDVDADADGTTACSDCDDANAAIAPTVRETCGPATTGVDDDCDGLVDLDDDSVQQWTCGRCEAGDDFDPALIDEYKYNPCLLDTGISLCDPATDTHTNGERLHRILQRNDGLEPRDEMFLFLPPGPGNQNDQVLEWAAFAGYRTIGLGWQNDLRFGASCTDSACFADVHHEHQDGTDTTAIVDIPPSDSVEGRLQTLLTTLAADHADEGWGSFLLADGTVDYSKIVLMGWSGGAAQSAWFTRVAPFKAALLVSGPLEVVPAGPEVFATWTADPTPIPSCAMFAINHRREPGENLYDDIYAALGVPDAAVNVDITPPPYDHANRFTTGVRDLGLARDCSPHKATIMDGCMPPEMQPFYFHVYCEMPQACDFP